MQAAITVDHNVDDAQLIDFVATAMVAYSGYLIFMKPRYTSCSRSTIPIKSKSLLSRSICALAEA